MKVGFTGTRNGLNERQTASFRLTFDRLKAESFHHGRCRGADADASSLVSSVPIIGYPGYSSSTPDVIDRHGHADTDRPPKSYFARNRDIVNDADVLIGAPPTNKELPLGGTWYTINYARKVGKPVAILWPDGNVTLERWP